MTPRVALLRPTRGLAFEESTQAALAERPEHYLSTFDRPIPDAFNMLVEQFFATDATHAWFVEEDVVPPPGALAALRALEADVAAIHYPLKDGGLSYGAWPDAENARGWWWVSTGCLLVARRVFDVLERPWFQTGRIVTRMPGSAAAGKILDCELGPREYGGHDTVFCFRAQQAGFQIREAAGLRCRHLVLENLGQPRSNDGLHTIRDA